MATFNGGVVAGSGDGGWIVSPSIFNSTAVNSAVGNTALVGNVPVHMFLHIPNVTIAPGSTINSALLTVVPDVTESGGAVNTILRAEASANPSPPTSQADATGRTRTTASVVYNNIPAYTDGVPVTLPDIAVVLQEIVNLPGWASGNSILLFWEDNGSSPGVVRTIAAVEHATLAAPSITIDYTPPVTTTPVGAQRSASWNALSTLGTERSASWSIQSPVPVERQALWALRATVGEDHLAAWSVFSAVAREADASWGVRALVNTSRASSWNVLSSVGADRVAPWSVRALVSVDGDVAWRVFGAVGTQRNVLWAARAPVGATTSALWDVDVVLLPGVVGSSRSAQWDVRQLVFVDRSAQWSALTIAPVERAVVWGVRTVIGAERDVQWSTFQLVGVERSIEWALLGFPVGVSASALWDVRFPVGAERIVLWNVVGLSAGIHYETPLLVRGSRGRTTAVGQRQARAVGPRGRTRVEVP